MAAKYTEAPQADPEAGAAGGAPLTSPAPSRARACALGLMRVAWAALVTLGVVWSLGLVVAALAPAAPACVVVGLRAELPVPAAWPGEGAACHVCEQLARRAYLSEAEREVAHLCAGKSHADDPALSAVCQVDAVDHKAAALLYLKNVKGELDPNAKAVLLCARKGLCPPVRDGFPLTIEGPAPWPAPWRRARDLDGILQEATGTVSDAGMELALEHGPDDAEFSATTAACTACQQATEDIIVLVSEKRLGAICSGEISKRFKDLCTLYKLDPEAAARASLARAGLNATRIAENICTIKGVCGAPNATSPPPGLSALPGTGLVEDVAAFLDGAAAELAFALDAEAHDLEDAALCMACKQAAEDMMVWVAEKKVRGLCAAAAARPLSPTMAHVCATARAAGAGAAARELLADVGVDPKSSAATLCSLKHVCPFPPPLPPPPRMTEDSLDEYMDMESSSPEDVEDGEGS